MIYRVDRKGNALVELEETTFPGEKVTEFAHIEEWVRKNPAILCDADEQIKIVSKQQTYRTGKRSDLVGVDDLGQLVVIELKRDIAEPMTEFQAIRYASSYLYSTYEDVCQIYARYLEEHRSEFGISEGQDFRDIAQRELETLCANKVSIPDGFNKNQRRILVSREFSRDVLSAASWLILNGIKIKCIALTPYKHGEDLFIVPRTILPTPEISDNIVRVREAREQVRREGQKAAYRVWEGTIEDHYNRLNPPLGERLRQLVSELRIEPSALSGSGFHLVHGDKKIAVSTWIRSKIEFRFPKDKKEGLESLLRSLNISSLEVKPKADIESYGSANPTPSIDWREDLGDFGDVIAVCRTWLETE